LLGIAPPTNALKINRPMISAGQPTAARIAEAKVWM
jgi:hypothetical protein